MNTIFNTFVPMLSNQDKYAGKQVMNTFVGHGNIPFSRDHLQLQTQLGSSEIPQRPVHGYSEAYVRLLRVLGIAASQSHTLGTTRDDFNTNVFVVATYCEKQGTVRSSGLNLQGVDMRVSGQYLSDGLPQPNSGISQVFFHCSYEIFLEFRSGSVTLLT